MKLCGNGQLERKTDADLPRRTHVRTAKKEKQKNREPIELFDLLNYLTDLESELIEVSDDET